MTTVRLAFGRESLAVEIPAANLRGVLRGREALPVDLAAAARSALAAPLHPPLGEGRGEGSSSISPSPCPLPKGEGIRLRELARGKRRAVILISDQTRPAPDAAVLPALLEELAAGGLAADAVTLLVAAGLHRPMREEELAARLGPELRWRLCVKRHLATAPAALADLGRTSDGCPILVNRLAVEADLLLATGVVEPHLWAGYSGGAKAVAVGAAGAATIGWLHAAALAADPPVRLCETAGNPLRRNADAIAKRAGLAFIVNAVLDGAGRVAKLVAGAPEAAFARATALADGLFRVPLDRPAEIVLVGIGAPKDENLYQASRAADYVVASPQPAVTRGGTIILAAPVREGAGGGAGDRAFYELTRAHPDPAELLTTSGTETLAPGAQRALRFACTRRYARVVWAGLGEAAERAARELAFATAPTVAAALAEALALHGPAAGVHVIPHGLHAVTAPAP